MNPSRIVVPIVLALLAIQIPASGQSSLEDQLGRLIESVTRLTEAVERRDSSGDVRHVELAVRILDIRARQQDTLQQQVRSLEDREQRTLNNIASNETKAANLRRRAVEAVDDATRLEFETQRDQVQVYIENSQKQLEYYATRRADLESQLIAGSRLTREVEGIVDDWLAELQSGER